MVALSAADAAKILSLRSSKYNRCTLRRYFKLKLLEEAESDYGRPVHPVELGYRMVKLTGVKLRPRRGQTKTNSKDVTNLASNNYRVELKYSRVARIHTVNSGKRCIRYYLTDLGRSWIAIYATQIAGKCNDINSLRA